MMTQQPAKCLSCAWASFPNEIINTLTNRAMQMIVLLLYDE